MVKSQYSRCLSGYGGRYGIRPSHAGQFVSGYTDENAKKLTNIDPDVSEDSYKQSLKTFLFSQY